MKDLVILILALITITAVGTAAYLYGKTQNPSLSLNSVSGTATPVSSSTPVATNSASVKGVVTGRLCFPASILPKGKIDAGKQSLPVTTPFTLAELVATGVEEETGVAVPETEFKLKEGFWVLPYK